MFNSQSVFLSLRVCKGANSAKEPVFLLGVFLALVLATLAFATEVPKMKAEIPIFSQALENKVGEAERFRYIGGPIVPIQRIPGFVFKDSSLNIYTTNSPVEEVFNFYFQKLGVKENGLGERKIYLDQLEPGNSTLTAYIIDLYESQLNDQYDELSGKIIRSGNSIKNILHANRMPYRPDQWIAQATFYWATRETKDEITVFSLSLEDWSFSDDWKTYKTKTQIVITRETYELLFQGKTVF